RSVRDMYRSQRDVNLRLTIVDLRFKTLRLRPSTRRRFLTQCCGTMTAAYVLLPSALATSSGPDLHFPSQPRARIAIASYPFREFIAGENLKSGHPTIELKDFAAHVMAKFNINKIEPWTGHFPSTDTRYLEEFRAAVEKAHGSVINIAVDGEHSPYAADRGERELALAFNKKWVDAASVIGSPCI